MKDDEEVDLCLSSSAIWICAVACTLIGWVLGGIGAAIIQKFIPEALMPWVAVSGAVVGGIFGFLYERAQQRKQTILEKIEGNPPEDS